MNSNLSHNSVRPLPRLRPVGLALQGGGSWGAYTWGALDALLASRSVEIRQLSGTSAGAINAAIVAGSLAKDRRRRPARRCARFGRRSRPRPPPILSAACGVRWSDNGATPMNDLLLTSGIMSVYAPSSLAINPLRDAIAKHVESMRYAASRRQRYS